MTRKQKPELTDEVKEFFARHGRVGGRSKSAAKVEASRANMEKALEKRWKKRFRGRLVKG